MGEVTQRPGKRPNYQELAAVGKSPITCKECRFNKNRLDGVVVVFGKLIRNTREARVDIRSAEITHKQTYLNRRQFYGFIIAGKLVCGPPSNLLCRHRRRDLTEISAEPVQQRMTDELDAQLRRVLRIPLALEGKNREQQIVIFRHLFRAAWP